MITTAGNGTHRTITPLQAQTRAAWDDIARGYDELVTPTHLWLGAEALARAGVHPGTRFLDVACGSGGLSIPAARLGAHVTATDLSPVMIQRLEARARQEGLSNLEARVMDGHALDLENDTFDVSGSQFGVMSFPDLPRALGELVRVTRPGGRVLMVAFGPPEQVEFLTFFLGPFAPSSPTSPGCPPSLLRSRFRWRIRIDCVRRSPLPISTTSAWSRSPSGSSSNRAATCGDG
jgi:SAM-dependent methyltransferase